MALSTATVMRTITSVMVIATTVVEPPPEALTTTVTPEQTTAINAPIEKPTTDSIDSTLESMPASSATSNTENSSSVPAHLSSTPISQSIQSPSSAPAPPASSSNSLPAQNTPSSGQFSVSTAVPDLNTPVFDRLHTTTSVPNQNTPVFDRLHTTTSVPNPNTPVFDKQPTRTSVPDLNTPVFDKPLSTSTTPAQTTSVFDKQTTSSSVPAQDTSVTEQPTTSSTSNQEILSSLSSQETSLRATSEPSPQTTQQSSPEVSSSVTSHSVEKAILLPTSTASSQTTLSSSSSESSSTVSSDLPSTFQTSVISTAATSVETTKSSDKTATSDEITNPQTTYTTATLPGGAITSIPLDATAANENAHPSDTNYPIVGGADSSSGNEKTPIIVGGIIGGIAALLAIVILIWFLKRKISRHRRSTLLTPLSLAPGAGGGGRDKYQSNTASLGPTSRTTKLAAALNHYPKKLSEKMSQMPTNNESPGVNMNRGNSQFEPIATHSRHGSVDPNGDTHSERLRGWWSQAIQDASSDDLTEQNITEKPHYAGHPYFANTDDDSQRRRMSQPTSVSSWTDGAPSPNPFTDANAASGRGGVSTYLQDLEGAGNPFADENSITPPAVAQTAPIGNIQEVQRSRPQTVNRGPSSRMMPRTEPVVDKGKDAAQSESEDEDEEPAAAEGGSDDKKKSKRTKVKEALTGKSSSSNPEADFKRALSSLTPQQLQDFVALNPALAKEVSQAAGSANPSAEDAANLLRKLNLQDIMTGLAASGKNVKDMGSYKFWQTQPVPRFGEEGQLEEGPLRLQKVEDVPKEPAPLVSGFEWVEMDLTNDEEMKEVYELLNGHYVEDDEAMFRFNYSPSILRWAMMSPGWKKEYHVGVRASQSRKLVAFISAIPVNLRVRDKYVMCSEVNFLSIHKKLRGKRLTPILIKEITRRSNLNEIWQGLYTAGVVLPKPVSTCRYYHRAINWQKLYEVGFSPLPPNSKPQYQVRKYALPDHTSTKGLRAMEEKDIEAVIDLNKRYSARYDMAPDYTREEAYHWFLPKVEPSGEQVVWTYVVEDNDNKITDFFSFFCIESSVIGNPKHKVIRVAYMFYYATEVGLRQPFDKPALKTRLNELIHDALILSKKYKFDVFNALSLMDNALFLEQQKFGGGDGQLHYYLFNYRLNPIAGGVNQENKLDEEGLSGIGTVMP